MNVSKPIYSVPNWMVVLLCIAFALVVDVFGWGAAIGVMFVGIMVTGGLNILRDPWDPFPDPDEETR